jgi:Winged helix-turn helix
MSVVSMRVREGERLAVLAEVRSGALRVSDACRLLSLKRRQVFRLLARVKQEGALGVVSRRRGKPGNHRHPAGLRALALSLVRERYGDFGPTLAAEALAERHGCVVSRETLRHWMMADGLWTARRRRRGAVHQPRRRRDCVGDLVQIDGSEHAWFEARGERCTLLAFIDDATSRAQHLRFAPCESTFEYFRSVRAYLETHGKPVAFYSDKHGIFRVNKSEGAGGLTQFGRAMAELSIGAICADTPQAKGRVERAFGTLQDRLVKAMRLDSIATIEAANAWLPGFVADYNRRFACVAASAQDLHRPLGPADNLDAILVCREWRTVTQSLAVQWKRTLLLLEPTPFARSLARKRVEVVDHPDGRLTVRSGGVSLAFHMIRPAYLTRCAMAPDDVVDSKRLSAVLALLHERQAMPPATIHVAGG